MGAQIVQALRPPALLEDSDREWAPVALPPVAPWIKSDLRCPTYDGTTSYLTQADTMEGILASFRLCYAPTPRETRRQLEGLRRDPSTTLQEHAGVVEKFSHITYAALLAALGLEMTMERFLSSLDNSGLQKDLLGLPTPNLEAAFRRSAGNEYLQLAAKHTY